MNTNILKITSGKTKEYTVKDKTFKSAYKKDTLHTSVEVTTLGLLPDQQSDKRYHGGEDKAILIGSNKHFNNYYQQNNIILDSLVIGQNILIDTLDESNVCVGDIYTIGELIVEVTQPRQPCWKIGALFSKEIHRYINIQSATGWYVRVLKIGILDINSKMVLTKRVSDITIKELTHYLHTPPKDSKLIEKILNIKPLAESYKVDFREALLNI